MSSEMTIRLNVRDQLLGRNNSSPKNGTPGLELQEAATPGLQLQEPATPGLQLQCSPY